MLLFYRIKEAVYLTVCIEDTYSRVYNTFYFYVQNDKNTFSAIILEQNLNQHSFLLVAVQLIVRGRGSVMS